MSGQTPQVRHAPLPLARLFAVIFSPGYFFTKILFEASAELHIREAPIKRATAGQDVTLTCVYENASGSTTVSMGWARLVNDPYEGAVLRPLDATMEEGRFRFAPSQSDSGVTTLAVTVGKVTKADTGPYKCVMEGKNPPFVFLKVQ